MAANMHSPHEPGGRARTHTPRAHPGAAQRLPPARSTINYRHRRADVALWRFAGTNNAYSTHRGFSENSLVDGLAAFCRRTGGLHQPCWAPCVLFRLVVSWIHIHYTTPTHFPYPHCAPQHQGALIWPPPPGWRHLPASHHARVDSMDTPGGCHSHVFSRWTGMGSHGQDRGRTTLCCFLAHAVSVNIGTGYAVPTTAPISCLDCAGNSMTDMTFLGRVRTRFAPPLPS